MILAIDQGTTGTTCLVFDADRPSWSAAAYREFTQHFPQPGWVEHDAAEIWDVTRAVAVEALDDAGVRPRRARRRSASRTSARRSACGIRPRASRCTARSCGRTAAPPRAATSCARRPRAARPRAHRARARPLLLGRRRSSGCCDNVEGLRERARGRAGRVRHDRQLADLQPHRRARDRSLQRLAHAALRHLPAAAGTPTCCGLLGTCPSARCRRSSGESASSARRGPEPFRATTVPVAGVAGDQQAALFGQACLDPGSGKNTYGTGLVRAAQRRRARRHRRRPGCWRRWRGGSASARPTRSRRRSSSPAPPCSGCATASGSSARRRRPRRSQRSLDGNDGVYFVPALTGLGSPHWDPYARGTIVGLTRGTTRAHLARAALEAIAYQTVDAVRAMEAAAGEPLKELRGRRRRDRERAG